MKILRFPHLPYKLDVKVANACAPFVFCPVDCWMQVKNMPKSNLRPKLDPIDLKTIHGVVRNKVLPLVENFLNENGQAVVNLTDKDGFTPMHWAALEGTVEIVNFLLSLDAEYDNNLNKTGQKPIHWACIKGRLDIATVLLNKGVDVNSQDERGYTPIIAACQYGHQHLVLYLMSKGAKIEIEDINGDSCLHWAAYKSRPELVRLLILYGCYPKKIDVFGQTVLHMACLGGNLNIVEQLLTVDCIDSEIRDKNGKRAVDLAKGGGHDEIVDYLERKYADKRNQCNWKTFVYGPVGNTRLPVVAIHIGHWFYEYPVFFLRFVPMYINTHFELCLAYIILNIFMWLSFYLTHLKEPGYLRQNTESYKKALKKITQNAIHYDQKEWNKQLARLCHSCRCLKPLRASHCRQCNRCVLAFDHHCPYIQNCIGYDNRIYFSSFVFSITIKLMLTFWMAYVAFYDNIYQPILYPGALIISFYSVMNFFLLLGVLTGALTNLTTNELVKKTKYDYLQVNGPSGKKNLFDSGCFYNIKHYFHLVEASPLECEEINIDEFYDV